MLRAILISICLLAAPVTGEVVARFDPGPGYEGHWGVDIEAEVGEAVVAAADGRVSFAGAVAGMRTVTVDHGHGMKTSVSHLDGIATERGATVRRGDLLGWAGRPHGVPGVHFSVRMAGEYVDPVPTLACLEGTIRLLPDR